MYVESGQLSQPLLSVVKTLKFSRIGPDRSDEIDRLVQRIERLVFLVDEPRGDGSEVKDPDTCLTRRVMGYDCSHCNLTCDRSAKPEGALQRS